MPVDLGHLQLHMGPTALGAPDDLEVAILNFIDGAKLTLDIAVQELELETIAERLVRLSTAGIRIRVVVEGDYLIEDEALPEPFEAHGPKEENRRLFAALHRAGVDARLDYNAKIFHQKFIVRDGKSVLTGSTNFTPTGVINNLNHLVIVNDRKVAREYSREFKRVWSGEFGRRNFRAPKAPGEFLVDGVRVKVLFAPDHNPEMEIMKQMLKARERIDFAIFTFSKSSGIDDTMIARAEAGLSVRGLFDSGQGNQDWAASKGLAAAGAEIYLGKRGKGKKPGKLGKVHHKLMVIDGHTIIAGSFNYTRPANTLNDENIIVIGDSTAKKTKVKRAQAKLCKHARQDIVRMIGKHGVRI